MIGVTVVLIAFVVGTAWWYTRRRFSHWSSQGVQTPPCIPFLGHSHKAFSSSLLDWTDEVLYQKYCRSGVCGFYELFTPVLMVGDPELIKCFLVKDFDHFSDRRVFKSSSKSDKIIDDMLVSENGEAWKNLRSLISPTFTSGKLRSMFPLICQKANMLASLTLQEATKSPSVNMRDFFARFIMDTIATCAFGFESNSLVDKDDVFTKNSGIFSDIDGWFMMKFMLLSVSPTLFNFFKLNLYPPDKVRFFEDVIREAIAARKKSEKRGDFLDLLLEAQTTDNSSKKILDDGKILAQCLTFLIGGYETTTAALAMTTFLLAKYPDEQQRLRQELQEMVKDHGGITYEGIMEAKFLDACLLETLRRYPPFPLTERVCTKIYQVPGTSIMLQPGHVVRFPIWSLQLDEQYYLEPKVFKPDRFMPENKENIRNYTFMPFGLGPRNCIAFRFALMESKIALAKLILTADIKLPPGQEELQYSTASAFIKLDKVPILVTPWEEE